MLYKNQIFNKKSTKLLIFVVFISFILLFAFQFLNLFKNDVEKKENTPLTDLFNIDKGIIVTEDKTKVYVEDLELRLKDGWYSTVKYTNPASKGFSCVDLEGNDCSFTEIVKDNVFLYVSKQNILSFNSGPESTSGEIEVEITNGEIIKITTQDLYITEISESGEFIKSEKRIFKQLHYCNNELICVSTGLMSSEYTRNQNEYNYF